MPLTNAPAPASDKRRRLVAGGYLPKRLPEILRLRAARAARRASVLVLLALCAVGCADAHGRIEGTLYVHLCDAMPAADQDAWGEAAGSLNEARGELAVMVGHGPVVDCNTVDVCPGAAEPTRIGECTATVRYEPGTASDVAAVELEQLVEVLP